MELSGSDSDLVDPGGILVIGDGLHSRLDSQKRITDQVLILDDHMPNMIVVKDGEAISSVIEGISKLRVACYSLQFQLIGLETEIHPLCLKIHGRDLGVVRKVNRFTHITELFHI